jgi:hypothetical protein
MTRSHRSKSITKSIQFDRSRPPHRKKNVSLTNWQFALLTPLPSHSRIIHFTAWGTPSLKKTSVESVTRLNSLLVSCWPFSFRRSYASCRHSVDSFRLFPHFRVTGKNFIASHRDASSRQNVSTRSLTRTSSWCSVEFFCPFLFISNRFRSKRSKKKALFSKRPFGKLWPSGVLYYTGNSGVFWWWPGGVLMLSCVWINWLIDCNNMDEHGRYVCGICRMPFEKFISVLIPPKN